jgi:endonuclease/exonuclease/phosphatase (EEP) superfamily protein YafD
LNIRIPSTLRRTAGRTLAGLSLLLLAATGFAFLRQPDALAAFTVVPLWLWAGIGIALSLAAVRAGPRLLPAACLAGWLLALMTGADEARGLLRLGHQSPQPGPPATHEGRPVIRVITLNCGLLRFGDPAPDLARWNPDIVLLQETYPSHARHIATSVFGGHAAIQSHRSNAIASRWPVTPRPSPADGTRNHRNQHAVVTLPDGRDIEVLNLHLVTATTDLRFWAPDAWRSHRNNRRLRREELTRSLAAFGGSGTSPDALAIVGGDFNAPANDIIHRQLAPGLQNAFSAVGTGWGNTYHRRLAILRIDHLYANRHLIPVRSRAHTTRMSDHRMVIADFLLPPPPTDPPS